jgi:hypothetical protein
MITRRRIVGGGAALLGALALSACNDPFSNEDILFLKSVPTNKDLSIDVPGGDAGVSSMGHALRPQDSSSDAGSSTDGGLPTPAEFYKNALKAGSDINGAVDFVLSLVHAIDAYPPTKRQNDARYWGPFPPDKNGIEWALGIYRSRTATTVKGTSTSTLAHAEGSFAYVFAGRLVSSTTTAFIPVIEGFTPIIPDADGSVGKMLLDFDAAKTLNPASKDSGRLYIVYDNRFHQKTVEVAVDSTPLGLKPFTEVKAGYRFSVDTARNTQFLFIQIGDVENPVPPNDRGPELLLIQTRFVPDRRGRADVVITDGDVGRGNYVYVEECWDSSFDRIYYLTDYPLLEMFGQLTDCAPGLQDANPFQRH